MNDLIEYRCRVCGFCIRFDVSGHVQAAGLHFQAQGRPCPFCGAAGGWDLRQGPGDGVVILPAK